MGSSARTRARQTDRAARSTPCRACGYARISRDQNERKLGVGHQIRRIKDYAAREGLTLTHVYSDNDLSAWKDGVVRPDFNEMLAGIEAGQINTVITVEASRITRLPAEAARFQIAMRKARGKVILVDGRTYDFANIEGQADWITDAAGNYRSSALTSKRVRESHDRRLETGVFRGGNAPFGWTRRIELVDNAIVRHWDIHPERAQVIRWAVDQVIAGCAVYSVARALTDGKSHKTVCGRTGCDCPPTPFGPVAPQKAKTWTVASLRNVLRNPRIAGLNATGEGSPSNPHTIHGASSTFAPIITVERYNLLLAALAKASQRKTTGFRVTRDLAGFVRCAHCGGSQSYDNRHLYWRHRAPALTSQPCPITVTIDAVRLEVTVNAVISARLDQSWEKPEESTSDIAVRIAVVEGRIRELDDAFHAGDLPASAYGRQITRGEEEIAKLQQEQREEVRDAAVISGEDAVEAWFHGDLTARRTVLASLVERIEVYPASEDTPRRQRARWTHQRVRLVWRGEKPRTWKLEPLTHPQVEAGGPEGVDLSGLDPAIGPDGFYWVMETLSRAPGVDAHDAARVVEALTR